MIIYRAARWFTHSGREFRAGELVTGLPAGVVGRLIVSGHVVAERAVSGELIEPELPAPPPVPWPDRLTAGARRALEHAGVAPGDDVAWMQDSELREIPGVGAGTVRLLREAFGGPPSNAAEAGLDQVETATEDEDS